MILCTLILQICERIKLFIDWLCKIFMAYKIKENNWYFYSISIAIEVNSNSNNPSEYY